MIRTAATGLMLMALGALAVQAGTTSLDEREKAVLSQPDSADRAYELAEAYRETGELKRGVAFFTEQTRVTVERHVTIEPSCQPPAIARAKS